MQKPNIVFEFLQQAIPLDLEENFPFAFVGIRCVLGYVHFSKSQSF